MLNSEENHEIQYVIVSKELGLSDSAMSIVLLYIGYANLSHISSPGI